MKKLLLALLFAFQVASAQEDLNMQVALSFPLASPGIENARADLVPADLDGDGRFEWILACGTKWIRAYSHAGTLLWSRSFSNGYASPLYHGYQIQAWDLDGDGREEPIVFTKHTDSDYAYLAVLEKESGATLADAKLWFTGEAGQYTDGNGLIAIAFTREARRPTILVSIDDSSRHILRAYEYTTSPTGLTLLWDTKTVNGGHFRSSGHSFWPCDSDGDGVHEIVFVGKHIIEAATGRLLWKLEDLGGDHVDGLMCADVDPDNPGLEFVTVGATGTRLWDLDRREMLWKIPAYKLLDPQTALILDAEPSNRGLEILVRERFSTADRAGHLLDRLGNILWSKSESEMPSLAIDANGSRATLEVLTDGHSRITTARDVLLTENGWFWNRQSPPLDGAEYWDRWKFQAIPMDVIGDPREEVIIWGQRLLVVGTPSGVLNEQIPSFRHDPLYRLAKRTKYRSPLFFDYGGTTTPPEPPVPPEPGDSCSHRLIVRLGGKEIVAEDTLTISVMVERIQR